MTDILALLVDAVEAVEDVVQAVNGARGGDLVAGSIEQYRFDIDADEAAMSVLLRADVAVLSEESGLHRPGREITVIVDPVDGSRNCARGLAPFGPSICAVDCDGVLAAVVKNLSNDETFTATRGGGARLDGSLLVAGSSSPVDLVATGDPLPMLETVFGLQTRITGASAHDLCSVAARRVDGYLDVVNTEAVWDYLAASLILTEAGGAIADRHGLPLITLDPSSRRHIVAAGTPALFRELVSISQNLDDYP